MLSVAVACGGGSDAETEAPATAEPAEAPAPEPASAMEMTMPDWFQVDEASQTVTMTITAGLTNAQNYWNFNGFTKDGGNSITVPEGYTVNIEFVNNDPNMAHSLGIETWMDSMAARPGGEPGVRRCRDGEPVFAHRSHHAR